MLKNYQIIEPHIPDIFLNLDYRENPYVVLLLEFIRKNDNARLEISKKIINGKSNQARLYILFDDDYYSNYIKCLAFLKQLGMIPGSKLNYEEGLDYLNFIDIAKLRLLVIGLDLRENSNESRIKIWLEFNNYPDLKNLLTNSNGQKYEEDILMTTNDFMVGVDFYLTNTFNTKLYLCYEDFISNNRLQQSMQDNFSQTCVKAMKLSDSFYISYKGDLRGKFLYFFSKDIKLMIDQLAIKIDSLDRHFTYFDHKPYIIAVFDKELEKNNIMEYNLYYLLQH